MVGWSPLAGLAALCHVRELEADDAEAVTRETHGECVPEVGVHARPGVVREDDRSGRCRWAVDDQDIQWGLSRHFLNQPPGFFRVVLHPDSPDKFFGANHTDAFR